MVKRAVSDSEIFFFVPFVSSFLEHRSRIPIIFVSQLTCPRSVTPLCQTNDWPSNDNITVFYTDERQ